MLWVIWKIGKEAGMRYEQLGEQMSSAVEYGSKGTRFWELDQIQQMYDIKRKRLERLFNTLGYGVEAASRIGDISARNKRLSDFAESKGYEVDTGFLGLGKPKYYGKVEGTRGDLGHSYDILEENMETGETTKTGDYTTPREEVSKFEMFGMENPDFADLFKL